MRGAKVLVRTDVMATAGARLRPSHGLAGASQAPKPWMQNLYSLRTHTTRLSPESLNARRTAHVPSFRPTPLRLPGRAYRSAAAAHVHSLGRIERAGVPESQPDVVEVHWEGGLSDRFSCVWLRDHCRGEESFDKANCQKTVDTHKIPANISAKKVHIAPGGDSMRVEWDCEVQGVRSSVYDGAWLMANRHGSVEPGRVQQSTWGREMKEILPSISVPFKNFMSSEEAVFELVHKVRVYGVAYVRETPLCKETTGDLCKRIGAIRETFYGGLWETVVKPAGAADNIDSAYSTVALPAHTDGNYFEDPPGLQIFHCLHADPKGGDTLLVDGFKVAEELQKCDPQAYNILCNTPVTFQHHSAEHHVKARRTIFGLDDAGRLERFHFNNLDRCTLRLPIEKVNRFYDALRILTETIMDPKNEVWIRLEPGNTIIINNRRVMHGRSSLNASSGRRLVGCYISYEDFMSKHRVLAAKLKKDIHALSTEHREMCC
mmetsp:Transcript_49477/g.120777  ORF Transcript_49477/g.120777 Transcript_49477/m.120777 type:complete len:489 (-) Transcript_49477:94-1560(-)